MIIINKFIINKFIVNKFIINKFIINVMKIIFVFFYNYGRGCVYFGSIGNDFTDISSLLHSGICVLIY